MTETLAMTTARMLREHFHAHGMTQEVAELDKAIEAEGKPQATDEGEDMLGISETHNG